MDKPKFSLLMPIYNKADCLEQSLASIKNQTYNNFEVIMIDDASNHDNSYEVMVNYANTDKRFKAYKNKENRGAGYTRNELLNKATGEYVIFIDPDDYIEADLLEKLKPLNDQSIDLIRFQNIAEGATDHQKELESKKNPYRFCAETKDGIMTRERALREWGIGTNKINRMPWTYCTKKSIYTDNNITFPNIRLHEDFAVVSTIIANAETISLLDYVGYHYLQYDVSLTRDESFPDYDQTINTIKQKMNDFILAAEWVIGGVLLTDVSMETKKIFVDDINEKLKYRIKKHMDQIAEVEIQKNINQSSIR